MQAVQVSESVGVIYPTAAQLARYPKLAATEPCASCLWSQFGKAERRAVCRSCGGSARKLVSKDEPRNWLETRAADRAIV